MNRRWRFPNIAAATSLRQGKLLQAFAARKKGTRLDMTADVQMSSIGASAVFADLSLRNARQPALPSEPPTLHSQAGRCLLILDFVKEGSSLHKLSAEAPLESRNEDLSFMSSPSKRRYAQCSRYLSGVSVSVRAV